MKPFKTVAQTQTSSDEVATDESTHLCNPIGLPLDESRLDSADGAEDVTSSMTTPTFPQFDSPENVTIEIARGMAHMLNTEDLSVSAMLERFGLDPYDLSMEDPSLGVDDPFNFDIGFDLGYDNDVHLVRRMDTWSAERH